jgi:hypothetical protein
MTMIRFTFFALLLLAVNGARATVSLEVAADRLDDVSGSPVPAGSLVLLVADTDGDGLGQVVAGEVSLRSFLDGISGDDLIVHRSDLSGLGIPGAYGVATGGLELGGAGSGEWSEGDPLYLVWFPNLSLATGSVPSGESYGARVLGLTPVDGSNEAFTYVAPVNGGTFGGTPVPLTSTNLRSDLATSQSATAPTVVAPSAVSITESSATVGGQVAADNGGAVTLRGVVYSVASESVDPVIGGLGVSTLSAGGGSGVFSVVASDLSSGITYRYRAFATNVVGTGYSASAVFTTDAQLNLIGGLASVSREMHPGDLHRFRFTLDSSRFVNLSTTGAGLRARLFNSSGQLVAERSVAGNVAFSNLLLSSGTHTIELFRDPGEGGALPYTLAVDASSPVQARPDGAVGTSLTSLSGNNLYFPTAQQLSLTSANSQTVTGYITGTNRGNISDRILFQGSASDSYFSVIYYNQSGANITAQMTAGTYQTALMAPGSLAAWVRAAVTPSRRAVQLRRNRTFIIDLKSVFNNSATDRVSVLVNTR